jgi:general secretion pathway protein N
LLLNGEGQWVGARLRFKGEASAQEGQETALNNLLNILGRRQGTRSLISLG